MTAPSRNRQVVEVGSGARVDVQRFSDGTAQVVIRDTGLNVTLLLSAGQADAVAAGFAAPVPLTCDGCGFTVPALYDEPSGLRWCAQCKRTESDVRTVMAPADPAGPEWVEAAPERFEARVGGVVWVLQYMPLPIGYAGWYLSQPAYPGSDWMGTTSRDVAVERASEQVMAWHRGHPAGPCSSAREGDGVAHGLPVVGVDAVTDALGAGPADIAGGA